MIIRPGFPAHDRAAIADLYWHAFGAKLGLTLGPRDKALQFITAALDPAHAITAHDDSGTLLGVAGFKTCHGALVAGDFSDMRRSYGVFGAVWRSALLSLLERDTENERFLIDGICVAPAARGHGVGTALLTAFERTALRRGYTEVRLDVIDTNRRAKALYLRQGFDVVDTQRMGPLRHIFGFNASETMVKRVAP